MGQRSVVADVPTALITVDGVLRSHSGLPIAEGLRFVQALSSQYRVALGSNDLDDDQHWLQIEGFKEFQEIVGDSPGYLRGQDHLLGQVDLLLGRGQEVALVVTPDPTRAALILHKGINALLFSNPKYSRPEWRPDYVHQMRPWDDIVREIQTQQAFEADQ